MKLEHYICLLAAENLGSNRSYSAVWHLLTGKKSIQTIQDAYLYEVECLYNIFAKQQEKLEQIIKELQQQNIIKIIDDKVMVSDKGKDLLQTYREQYSYIKQLQPILYEKRMALFYKRLVLTIQVISNHADGKTRFIPVVTDKDVQNWVRQFHSENRENHHIRIALYEELHQLLQKSDETFRSIFVHSLTGSNYYGKTNLQNAMQLNITQINYSIWFSLHMQKLGHYLKEKSESYPLLCSFLEIEEGAFTYSANKTYELLLEGYTTGQIANMRRLKQATIEDHIVELAYVLSDFPFSAFLPEEIFGEIIPHLQSIKTMRLGEIKKQVRPEISYFHIRLAIARWVINDRK